jgi:hypothetical protein
MADVRWDLVIIVALGQRDGTLPIVAIIPVSSWEWMSQGYRKVAESWRWFLNAVAWMARAARSTGGLRARAASG